jgi:hypothetical protein
MPRGKNYRKITTKDTALLFVSFQDVNCKDLGVGTTQSIQRHATCWTVRIRARLSARYHHSVHTDSGVRLVPFPVDTGGPFHGEQGVRF